MIYVVILSGLVYFFGNGMNLIEFLAFHPGYIMRGEIWRLVTWVFIPINAGFALSDMLFTLIALYFYYFIGSALEREWGKGKFTIYYLFGMALHVVFGFIVWFILNATYGTVGGVMYYGYLFLIPMYLNLSMFFAFAALFPDFTIRLMLIIPIKMKWAALINAGFFLLNIIAYMASGNFILAVLPLVALLNFALICGSDLLSNLRPMKYKASHQVVNFKKAAKQAKRDIENKSYRHKCAVCGKTDTDSPELDFRYCSKCNGYHCFCAEHINNHIHFE